MFCLVVIQWEIQTGMSQICIFFIGLLNDIALNCTTVNNSLLYSSVTSSQTVVAKYQYGMYCSDEC